MKYCDFWKKKWRPRKNNSIMHVSTAALSVVTLLHIGKGVFCLGTTGQKQDVKRTQRWITDEAPLTYLTHEMSALDQFKSIILRPFDKERVSGSTGNKDVQDHIKTLLEAWGWHVEEDTFTDNTPYGVKEFNNIIATYNPSKPKHVVLACHFDSKYFTTGKFVGATDSAVPCAILLETVKQLKCLLDKGPKSKSRGNNLSLQLLFLDGEEAFREWTATDSLYGARHLAQRWKNETIPGDSTNRINKIRELILLDLIGTKDTQFVQLFTSTSQLYNALMKIEKHLRKFGYLTGKHSGPIFVDRKSWGGIEDDHIPFLQKGVDVLHLISYPFPKVWHKLEDDWDHLDFNMIDDFSRIFRVFISNLLHLQPENRGCRKKTRTEL